MTFTAIFKDGPLGGQFREVEKAEWIIRVPSMPRVRITAIDSYDSPYPALGPAVEEVYELNGTRDERMLEYRWVNPADALRNEVKRLREKLARIELEARA